MGTTWTENGFLCQAQQHQTILQRILLALMLHLRADPNQALVFTHVEFALAENYRVRPDVLLLLGDKAMRLDTTRVPVPGAPDLGVEIISSSEQSPDTQEKLQAYLQYGTQGVWQIYPKLKSVVIYRGETSATLSVDQHLTTSLLPGFSLQIQSLFL